MTVYAEEFTRIYNKQIMMLEDRLARIELILIRIPVIIC
jgi:hypothetical protein